MSYGGARRCSRSYQLGEERVGALFMQALKVSALDKYPHPFGKRELSDKKGADTRR